MINRNILKKQGPTNGSLRYVHPFGSSEGQEVGRSVLGVLMLWVSSYPGPTLWHDTFDRILVPIIPSTSPGYSYDGQGIQTSASATASVREHHTQVTSNDSRTGSHRSWT